MEVGTLAPDEKVEQFKEEAGEPTGAMPPKPPKDEPIFDPEIVIDGSSQLSFDIGGKRPTESELRIVGGAIKVHGQYAKGELIEARITLRVGAVQFRDKRDSQTDQVIDCIRGHQARVVAFESVE